MKARISKRVVDGLAHGDSVSDTEIMGFIVRRLKSGTVTYGYRYRNGGGRQRWLPLGLHGQITPDQGRELAKRRAGEVAKERDPAAERQAKRASATNIVNAVLDSFLERYARKQLRSAAEIERTFDRLVRPRIGSRSVYDLSRRDVVEMLDAIEDNNGPVMADRTKAYLSKALNWWAVRDDKFTPPLVRGMARTKAKERARSRTLDDQEIRDLWHALDEAPVPACYPALVRTLLLTGQRRGDVADMAWHEIDDAVWTIPAERYKTKVDQVVPLPTAVLGLIGDRRAGFVFSSDGGKRPFGGFSKSGKALGRALARLRKREKRKPMPHWTLHDLRRTARSLMSRAGVQGDVAERVLGHVVPGVRGVYDRHRYTEEKRDALERLVSLIERILRPTEKVVRFPKGAR